MQGVQFVIIPNSYRDLRKWVSLGSYACISFLHADGYENGPKHKANLV